MKLNTTPKNIQTAIYTEQTLQERFAGNKLIEALPLPLNEEDTYQSLVFLPEFNESSRQWQRHDRLRELLRLSNIMVPLACNIQLSFAVDAMLRDGYVGRRPMSPEHIAIYQEIHEDSKKQFRQSYETVTPKVAQSLLAIPGMGKTTTLQRILARYPTVIYHPEFNLYQIPALHFEMPNNGKGVKGLLCAIIEAVAELIPNNNYRAEYIGKGRATEPQLQEAVRILLNKHCVGLLVPDEVQNVANTKKSDQEVMTTLTTISNKSKSPVLWVGTPKAAKILGLDLRQARRSINLGVGDWSPLPRTELVPDESGELIHEPGEWVDFMHAMWTYCWVQNPVPLSEELLDAFYYCTQGVIDLALKLFIVAQAKAILDETETLSVQLVMSVYQTQFKLLHPMVTAMRENDREAMMRYQDLGDISVEDTVEALARRRRINRNHAATTRPGQPDFQPRLADAAIALGVPQADAEALAQQVADDGTAKNMLDAVAQLTQKAAPLKKTLSKNPKSNSSCTEDRPSYPGIQDRPDDLRHAIVEARRANTSIVEQLLKLRLVREPEATLCEA